MTPPPSAARLWLLNELRTRIFAGGRPGYEPDYEPDIGEVDEERPRDPVVDQAKDAIRAFFDRERANGIQKQQLEVIFEEHAFFQLGDIDEHCRNWQRKGTLWSNAKNCPVLEQS